MEAATLSHATGKLWLYAIIGTAFVALAIWIDLAGVGGDYHGRGAWLVAVLGPTGTALFFAAFGLACALLTFMVVRLLLSPDRLAATADAQGVMIRSLYGVKNYRWDEIANMNIAAITAGLRTQYILKVAGNGCRGTSLPAGTIEGGRDALEQWLEDAAALHRQVRAA